MKRRSCDGLLWGLAWGGGIVLLSLLAGCGDPPTSKPVGAIGTELHAMHHLQQQDLLVPEAINRFDVLVCSAGLDPYAVRAVVHKDAKILQAYAANSVGLWGEGVPFWEDYRAAMSNLEFAWTGIPERSRRLGEDGKGDSHGGGMVGANLDDEGRIKQGPWNAYFIKGTLHCAEANAIFMASHQAGWDGVYIDMATPGEPAHVLRKLAREGAFGPAIFDLEDIPVEKLHLLQRQTYQARVYLFRRLRELAPDKLILINAWGERHRAQAQRSGIESPFYADDEITLVDGLTFEYPLSASEPENLAPTPASFDSWGYITRIGPKIRAIRGECYNVIWYRPGWTISDNYGLLLRGGYIVDRSDWFGPGKSARNWGGQGLSFPEYTRDVQLQRLADGGW